MICMSGPVAFLMLFHTSAIEEYVKWKVYVLKTRTKQAEPFLHLKNKLNTIDNRSP